MANELATQDTREIIDVSEESKEDFVTFRVGEQLFGVPVLKVRDILHLENIAFIPLAPPHITGSINLRGHIVTVIDVRVCLGLPPAADDDDDAHKEDPIGVTVEYGAELYNLLVDSIGDVLSVSVNQKEPIPNTLEAEWRKFATCIYPLEGELLVILEPDQLVDQEKKS